MFECGDGRISELLSRWLLRLGLTSRTFVQQMEAVAGDTEEVSGARRLVEPARGCWPHSSEVSRHNSDLDDIRVKDGIVG